MHERILRPAGDDANHCIDREPHSRPCSKPFLGDKNAGPISAVGSADLHNNGYTQHGCVCARVLTSVRACAPGYVLKIKYKVAETDICFIL